MFCCHYGHQKFAVPSSFFCHRLPCYLSPVTSVQVSPHSEQEPSCLALDPALSSHHPWGARRGQICRMAKSCCSVAEHQRNSPWWWHSFVWTSGMWWGMTLRAQGEAARFLFASLLRRALTTGRCTRDFPLIEVSWMNTKVSSDNVFILEWICSSPQFCFVKMSSDVGWLCN